MNLDNKLIAGFLLVLMVVTAMSATFAIRYSYEVEQLEQELVLERNKVADYDFKLKAATQGQWTDKE